MTERDLFMRLFDISINTFYLWKRQGRLIFDLIEKYFTKEDLEEFLNTGKISRLESTNIQDLNQRIERIEQQVKELQNQRSL